MFQVLTHYGQFRVLAHDKRDRLEEARQFQYFKRDADELEIWILEKLQTAQEENYRDPTNLQVIFDSVLLTERSGSLYMYGCMYV